MNVASRGSPMRPSATALVAVACPVAHRNSVPRRCTTPASRAAASIASPSAASRAKGFSHTTWRPAPTTSSTMSRWVCGGVATVTASTPGMANASASEVHAFGTSAPAARVLVRASSRPTSARTSNPAARSARTWVSTPNPVPTTAAPIGVRRHGESGFLVDDALQTVGT